MKTVRGTVVRRYTVESVLYATVGYCEECLGEQKLGERPAEPKLGDYYDEVLTQEQVWPGILEKIQNAVRQEGVKPRIVGYRCNGCDRRIQFETRSDEGTR